MYNEGNGQNDNKIQFPLHHQHVASLFAALLKKEL